MSGAGAITQDLLARLQRHYIKPGQDLPGGVFLPEVGVNGSWGASGRCDAIYVGFTGSSGRLLVGHEVKASRADWLAELRKPGKADQWADQCHEWWLVTAPGVVAAGELPAGWGHMVPGKSRTRMQVLERATRHADRTPSWDAVRSVIARQDTLRSTAINLAKIKAEHDARAHVDERAERRAAFLLREAGSDVDELRRRAEAAEARLGLLEDALGVTIDETTSGWRNSVAVQDLAAIARHLHAVKGARAALADQYGGAAQALEQAAADVRGVAAALALVP